MAKKKSSKAAEQLSSDFDIVIVGQSGRLQYECLLLAASLKENAPSFSGTLYVAEPQAGPLWDKDPTMAGDIKGALTDLGAVILPFENTAFGESYPNGNKIEALCAMPEGRNFLFLDSDTLIVGDIGTLATDFSRPSASMRRTGTWPEEELYWPGYSAIWKSLYDRYDLDFESTLDPDQPDEYWEHYLYFNAGWVTGHDAPTFGARWRDWAVETRDNRPEELVLQSFDPWLDQVTLPLVIHSFGGGRPGDDLAGLDGDLTCHYRLLPLLYAREADAVVTALEDVTAPNKVKKWLKQYDPFKRMIYQKRGQKVRDLFDQNDLPPRERQLRNRIKREGFWMR
ncbi:hypothetical protein Q4555_03225 [Octadecabacter sp. 1_MG-2023]|uniref:hypothetical protein n=1 Tax=unclassified Octadecabacter TaxID=196158 RepID=UPI001C08396B|nr:MULTISPECIES: hypothetical protein [unclassified Octadecabacter]MBU2992886.1 hypothetical protein [Octadecabacter sp. B2R22]MDO6733663.1 hypothetical protein [Octadecabacter sp. 1_MG-2023]